MTLFQRLHLWIVSAIGSIRNVRIEKRVNTYDSFRLVADSRFGEIKTPWVTRFEAEALFEKITAKLAEK